VAPARVRVRPPSSARRAFDIDRGMDSEREMYEGRCND